MATKTARRKLADPEDVREAAETMPMKFLECRDFQHRWKPHTARLVSKREGYERVLRCDRCLTRKLQNLSSSGAVLSTRYVHPEGYLFKDMGLVAGESRDIIRLTSVVRHLAGRGVLKKVS